jgi:LmbE family N-acetylglucosaminyl deacetylase
MIHYTADGMLTQAIIGDGPPSRKLARAIQQPFWRFLAAPLALPICASDRRGRRFREGLPDVNTYDCVYLSPHLDDAVLSCGGAIWQQVQAGERVLVVTVFAGAPAPDTPLSPFAEELHARWGRVADAAAVRQEEDGAALALLGAKAAHWPYPDCIYRQTPAGHFPYASEEALWGEVHPAEHDLVAELAARLAALPQRRDGTVYGPLGVGHHVDHRIVRQAAEASGHPLTCYEDFPYAQDQRAVQLALAQVRAQARLVLLCEDALASKIAAIACYRSQLGTFWPGEAEMATSVRTFAERTGGGVPAERYWKFHP